MISDGGPSMEMIAIRTRDGKRIDRCAASFHADVSLPQAASSIEQAREQRRKITSGISQHG